PALGGTALPLVFFVAFAVDPARGGIRLGHASLAAGAVVWLDLFHLGELQGYSAAHKAALTVFLAAGLLLVGDAVRRARPLRSERGFLLLWLAGAVLGSVVLLPFGTARYMLPVLPPLFLLIVAPDARDDSPAAAGTGGSEALRLAAALSLCLSLLLGIADHEFAGAYRDFARNGVPAVAAGHRVFFIGDWGFRYYME